MYPEYFENDKEATIQIAELSGDLAEVLNKFQQILQQVLNNLPPDGYAGISSSGRVWSKKELGRLYDNIDRLRVYSHPVVDRMKITSDEWCLFEAILEDIDLNDPKDAIQIATYLHTWALLNKKTSVVEKQNARQ
jgi:hypothetical protein